MDLLELFKERYSCRNFSDKRIEKERIDKILEAARLAPTACNNEPFIIYSLESKEALETFKKCTRCHFNEQLVFIVCGKKDEAWVREYDNKNSLDVDCSIIGTHMMLEAKSLGIDSTWVMYFISEAIKEEFNLDDNLEPVLCLLMGYSIENDEPSIRHNKRKNIDELVIKL